MAARGKQSKLRYAGRVTEHEQGVRQSSACFLVFAWLISSTAVACAAAVGCGARTPLDDDDGDGEGQGAAGPGPSGGLGAGAGCGSPVPKLVPWLWYPFDGHTRNVGSYGGLIDAVGPSTTFAAGVSGQSIEIAQPVARVELTGAEVALMEVSAMSLFLRFQEAQPPALQTVILDDRATYTGLHLYHGVSNYNDNATICWGAGDTSVGTGDCMPVRLPSDASWHEVLLVREHDRAATEAWVDGALGVTLFTVGFDLFADAATPMLGGNLAPNQFTGDGLLRVDDVRLYYVALDARARCRSSAACGAAATALADVRPADARPRPSNVRYATRVTTGRRWLRSLF